MSALPPLNPADQALLTRYLLAREDLHSLLAQPNPNSSPDSTTASATPELLTLLHFLARPDITPWLDHYRAIMAHARQHAALNALAEVFRTTTDPNQRRLAATTLLHNRTPRAPRPPQPPLPPHPEAHGSDPWASPARRNSPRALRHPSPSPPDASMHHATKTSRLNPVCSEGPCTPASIPSPNPENPHPASAPGSDPAPPANSPLPSPTSLDHALVAIALRLDADHAHDARDGDVAAIARRLDGAIDRDLDDDIDRPNDDSRSDSSLSDDPLLAAALIGDPDAINQVLERSARPLDPDLVLGLDRALRPAPIASHANPPGPEG